MLVNRTMGGGLPAPSFWLELRDAGAGAVNTTPSLANGSPTATFTRATTAWTKLSTGLWASVASGSARSCYLGADTTVGAYGGYFAEGAGIQLVTPTASIRDMSDASWAKVTITAAKTSTGIDGAGSSCSRVTATAGNGTILQTLVAAASNRTYSCFIKRITGTGEIDISEDGTTWTDITSQINSATFTRVSITVSQLNAAFGLRIVTNGDAIDVDFNQFEAGAFATSPMATAGAARNTDVLNYAYAGNADTATGAAYAELSTLWTAANAAANDVAISIGNAAAGWLFGNTPDASTIIATLDGTTTVKKTGLTNMNTASRKRACSWGLSGQSITGDGVAVATGLFDGAFGNNVNIGIGHGSSANSWYGCVKNVRIWTRQIADSQLVSLTQ